MTQANTLAMQTRTTPLVDGLAVEVFATEAEARTAWNLVPSYVEQQAAAFVAAIGLLAIEQDERKEQQ